jgi:hypothetical protein
MNTTVTEERDDSGHQHDDGACITVIYGSPQNFSASELAGKTCAEAIDHLREVMNLPDGYDHLLVGSRRVEPHHRLQAGDHFEVVRASGSKG